ncbi:phage tail assembly chaperone [Granulibacter bethesdensis]|uniref:Uncharacterized protein n=1 Tax=Granulibacter bethesdensis (strain ATCC BAA-1260 / CGDNIH1) TaxID=391165 RepID=Q0BRT2_GRABC|nr:hypothetical protein [Granulibacter bethesdensis]ABI62470.1 Hypothetical protein GbCGDNIH1_1572 [Granulibacter bethesdensis CGDNIH1]APH52311.1 Hypothetical protein GbCGDNIH5_1572 [Granulibacter bethesdensis]APH65005.1 Hypothetical protein GbCGDNIH1I4_1572 [Granulibacter bethesdensis]
MKTMLQGGSIQEGRESVTIGAQVYHIKRFDPFRALRILGSLQGVLLAPFAALMDTARGEEAIMQGLRDLSRGLDGEALEKLARLLLDPDCIAVGDDPATARRLSHAMAGSVFSDVSEAIELCMEVVRINYAGFFERGRTLIGQVLPNGTNRKAAMGTAMGTADSSLKN